MRGGTSPQVPPPKLSKSLLLWVGGRVQSPLSLLSGQM